MSGDDGRGHWRGVYTGQWLGYPGRPASAWTKRIRSGREIGFTRTWHGHRMSDDECRALLAGRTIALPDVPRTRAGDPPVRVRLGEYLWRHRVRSGIMAANRSEQTVPVPRMVMGRALSGREREALAAGRAIRVSGLHNPSTMRDCSATLVLRDDERGRGHLVILAMESAPSPPRSDNAV